MTPLFWYNFFGSSILIFNLLDQGVNITINIDIELIETIIELLNVSRFAKILYKLFCEKLFHQ